METPSISDDSSDAHGLIDELADEYVSRLQIGESPSISEYCQAYPDLTLHIRELFPLLSTLEQVKLDHVDASESAAPPARVGDYDLIREIGRGGMGVVYEARHSIVGRSVAIKLLPQRLANDPRARSRFEREARAIAAIHHTNVVPLFEFGRADDQFFLVMQLIDGNSIDKLILRRLEVAAKSPSLPANAQAPATQPADSALSAPKSPMQHSASQPNVGHAVSKVDPQLAAIASTGMQIANALDYAHRRGIIHRDVKPSNILLDSSGVAWLTDFGLAKTDGEDLTQTGDFLGTLRYTAPERFRGICDDRSDVYSLGLTLYELLTLRPAVEGSDRMQVMHAIEARTPTPLRRLCPTLPRDLETIVQKSMEQESANRYDSAGCMAEDLRRFLCDEPIEARRPSLAERFSRWRRHNVALSSALAIALLISVVTLVGAVAASVRENKLRKQAEQSERLVSSSHDALLKNLYAAEMNMAGQAMSASGGVSRVTELVSHWQPSSQMPDLRGWEWYYMNAACRREQFAVGLAGVPAEVENASWNPAGSLVATVCSDGRIVIWDANDNVPLFALAETTATARTVAWSPDGTHLASGGRDHCLRVWDLASRQIVREYQCDANEAVSPHWAADSRSIAWGSGKEIVVANVVIDEEPRVIGRDEQLFAINVIQWSPDASCLFAANWWQNSGGVWHVAQQKRLVKIPGRRVDWEPKGHAIRRWCRSTVTGRIDVVNSDSGLVEQTLLGHNAPIRSLEFSLDGEQLLSASDDRSIRIWNLADGRLKDVLQGHTDSIFLARWSPTQDRIASTSRDNSLRIWRVQSAFEKTLDGPETRVQRVTWRPDGAQLACVTRDGKAYIWDTATQSLLNVLEEENATFDTNKRLETCVWSPDGNQFLVAGSAGLIRILDAHSLGQKRYLSGHTGSITQVTFQPGGEMVASIGTDKTLRIWQEPDGTDGGHTKLQSRTTRCVIWSPQGSELATGNEDGSISV